MKCQNVGLKWVPAIFTVFLILGLPSSTSGDMMDILWEDGNSVAKCVLSCNYVAEIPGSRQTAKAFVTNKILSTEIHISEKKDNFDPTQERVCRALINKSQTIETFYCQSYL